MIEPDASVEAGRVLQLPSRYIRFGPFQVDQERQAVTASGSRLKVRGKAYQILLVLLEKRGGVVTREELRVRLWPTERRMNYDTSVNTAMNKLRKALRDSSDKSLYIQTVPRLGYRLAVQPEFADSPVLATPVPPDRSNRKMHSNEGYSFASKSEIWITLGVISLIVGGMLLGAAIARL
jgi:DNA-binding winged helix-turn-helix (wHTH) protein